MVGLSTGEKHFIKGGIAQDLRSDGRKRLAYRPIYVETGVIPQVMYSELMPRIEMPFFTDLVLTLVFAVGKWFG